MNKNKCFLSIDNGLTMIKAAILDLNGAILGTCSDKNEVINNDSHSEVDMGLLAKKTFAIIKEVIKKTGINPSDIISIGNSGHGAGLYLLDENGIPVRNAITSMDARSSDLIDEWNRKKINSYSKTYAHMWNGQAIPLLYWLKAKEESSYKKTHKILFCKDWIKYKLTGVYSTDYTDASNSGLINLNTRNYDPDIYKLYNLEEISEKLPKLSKSEEIIGYITEEAANETGLIKGTPVMGGCIDLVACILGSGLYDNSSFSLISGTWSINSAIDENISKSPDITSTILFADPKKFLVMDVSPTSAVNLEWFLSEILEKMNSVNLSRKQIYEKIDEEILDIKINETDLFYFPFIYKSKLTKKVEGMFYGFNASHNIYNLIFSIYEGVVFAHHMHITNLKKGGIERTNAVISGGASNSSLWCQMFADILNMEILTTQTSEVGVLGLAICQGIGIGLFGNIKDAISKLVRIKSSYKPDRKKNAIYMKRYGEFQRIFQLLENN
jgi:L-xylulokinase